MGKQNVQNLISFYLNADMYRQYARKELIRNSNESTSPGKLTLAETREALKEFAKAARIPFFMASKTLVRLVTANVLHLHPQVTTGDGAAEEGSQD